VRQELRSGVLLCELANKLSPGVVKKVLLAAHLPDYVSIPRNCLSPVRNHCTGIYRGWWAGGGEVGLDRCAPSCDFWVREEAREGRNTLPAKEM
jgi:hypothetical protein